MDGFRSPKRDGNRAQTARRTFGAATPMPRPLSQQSPVTPVTTTSPKISNLVKAISKAKAQQSQRITVKFQLPLWLSRLVRLARKHQLATRIIAGLLAVLMIFTLYIEYFSSKSTLDKYDIQKVEQSILPRSVDQYGTKLVPEKDGSLKYNTGYSPAGEIAGQSFTPKFTAEFSPAPDNKVTITDPATSSSFGFKPTFGLDAALKNKNRVIYPIKGKQGSIVYTLQASTAKEDIILFEKGADKMEFTYDLVLGDSLEARMEQDGSVGVYGVDGPLQGNVATSTEADAALLLKARQNAEKNKLIFKIPAPFVLEAGNKRSTAKAWFSLKDNRLTIHAKGLDEAQYPLSIDPTVYIETARKLMRGNNETNVDFDVSNELIQKSQTTGARIDYWSGSTAMSTGVWDQAMATAGGYVYRAGGRVDPTMPYIVDQQATTAGSATTTFTMDMPASHPAGDLYVALIAHDGTGAVTPPAGWTEYADSAGFGTNTREHAAYYKIGTDQGGGDESATYAWTGSNVEWVGVILRIKNFNSGSPISATGLGTSGTDSIPQFPAVTPAHDATLIIRAVGIDQDQPSEATWLPGPASSPAEPGHTRIYSGSSSTNTTSAGLAVAYLDVPPLASNAAGADTFVNDGILNDTWGSSSIAIRPATVTAGVSNKVEWAEFNASTSAIDSPNPGNGVCSGWCNDSVYDLPANRVGMSMYSYNGYLYALGGTTDGTAANATTTVWIAKLGANGEPQLWHPTGGSPVYWYPSTSVLPAARSYTSIVAYSNRMYLVGGRDTSGNSLSTVHVADILPTGDLGSWSTTGMQTLPDARHGHSVHIYNDTMYLVGGLTTTAGPTNTFRNTVYYSKLTSTGTMNTWTATSSFTTARSSFGGQMSTVIGGYFYLAGGCTAITTGYCSSMASDVQLASINADGSLAPWNSILNLSNQRMGSTLMAWQGGLYRFGGCNRQNTSTGACYAVHQATDFGVINPDGDASTVSNSEPANTSPCSGSDPVNCDLPAGGDGAQQGGQMASMVVINNGYIYVIGGCTSVANNDVCETGGTANSSGNVLRASINSTGQLSKPATCEGGTYVTNSLWCVDSTRTINGTAGISAGAATVFNNTIYVAGGTDGSTWQNDVWRVSLNADGSLGGSWVAQNFATGTNNLGLTDAGDGTGTGDQRGYIYAFTRGNPSGAGTNPGNLYLLGGCVGATAAADGLGCSVYNASVIKCNISTDASLNGCTTTGQLQIDADNVNGGNQGLGLMAGTVYANRIYLVGGSCAQVGTTASAPCGATYAANRRDTIYAKIDASNNIVANSTTGTYANIWAFTSGQMSPVRRRAVAFGYNGYIYSLAGYSGSASLQDLLFAKINVSTGDMGNFDSSGVVVTPRWDLRAIVSNGYVYAIGGCAAGAAPTGCTAMQPEIQTFQLYNNDAGTPVGYSAGANLFATDRMGAGSAILNGYLYVAGGCTSTTDCTTASTSVQYAAIDSYGEIGTWSAGGNLPAARVWGQLEAVGGTLYYIGGQDSGGTGQTTVYYTSGISSGNPTWNGTAATNGLPAARTQLSTTVWDNRIYAVGGIGTGGTCSVANVCDTVYVSPKLTSGGNITTAWSTSTQFSIDRSGASVVAYANNLYLLGGFDGTNYLNDVQYAAIGYKTGTISQTGTTTVTGSGTTWTSAMVGSTLQYADGYTAVVTGFSSATSITVDKARDIGSGNLYTIQDGSVDSWTYTTSLPEAIQQGDAFAANGYIYLVGGRSSNGDCVPNTLLAPISANTTIASGNDPTGVGEWYETNARYTGDRYGNSVSYSNGKMYVLGGACESWPTVANYLSQTFTTDVTTHNVTMPATVDAGDLLLVFFTNDGNATITDPDGAGAWTQIATSPDSGNNVRGSVWGKVAAGTEDGTNVNFLTSANEQAAAHVYRIPATKWRGAITDVEASTNTNSTSTTAPNPGSLNPAGWGTENTLWFSYVAGSSYGSVTTYPANHTNGTHSTGGTGNNNASTSTTRRESRAASEDPGAYTMPANGAEVAYTVAVRPAAFTYTGADRVAQSPVYSQPQVAKYSRMIDTDTDVFPNSWLMNGLDNSTGARWTAKYRSMHDTSDGVGQQNPNEDCGTSATMPLMTGWGQETNYGEVTLGDVAGYTPLNSSGGNINCARYYYFDISIDASQTFGYPEDVNRGPTITDLSLFFTADPSKRLRHGKTFTGGQLQPLDTPCRQTVDANCPLP